MGRRFCPKIDDTRRNRLISGLGRLLPAATLSCALFAAASVAPLLSATPAAAQTVNDRIAARAGNPGKDRMLVDAGEIVYDRNNDTVGARGNVQIYYKGRILQANEVIYNRKTKRVLARGKVKLTEPDGTVAYATNLELTDDFRDGFINSLRAETYDRTHFTADRAERTSGETTVFNNGTYTACEPCKDKPEKPPFWRVRAKRIIHKNSERMVYFEDAVFEIWGKPIAYLPYFSMPDPTVKRKSGFLTPRFILRSRLGAGAAIPYFWALAPNYDLTLTPTLLTRQGFLGQVEWRHRLVNGSYSIRATGIFQNDPKAFQLAPFGPGNRNFRGSLESLGKFHINDKWSIGWDIKLLSDRWFWQDYRLPSANLSQNYFREATSTVYLTGQGARGYFDLRGYYFQGLSRADIQSQQPVVAPVLDYNKTIDIPPQYSAGIGGQLEIDFNFTNIFRDLASFEAIGGRRLDRAFGLYDVCEDGAGNRTYNRTACLVRGMGGNYARATLQVEWKRKFIDPIGQVWTPFAFARFNGTWLNLATSGSKTFSAPGCANPPCTSTIANAFQANFFNNTGNAFRGQATPGVGLEYRYPFFAPTRIANQIFEPIVQIVARPNEPRNSLRVNEDAQSLVFDDTNLFSPTKFSGYDRFEGGVRMNYGFQYTATFRRGGYANLAVGQSFQLAGRNSYANPDAANIGLGSGLDTRYSDIVARAAFAPSANFNFIAKGRFDPDKLTLRRLDLLANMRLGRFEGSVQYARYSAQPLIGFDRRREGLSLAGKVSLTKNISVNGNVIFDLSRHLYNNTAINNAVGRAPLFAVAGLGVGATYSDECTTLGVSYTSVLQSNGAGSTVRNQTLLVSLRLRTVGDTRVRSSLGAVSADDGLSAPSLR